MACRHDNFHATVDVHRILREPTDEMATAYHSPVVSDQVRTYEKLREAGKQFALTINDLCPESADKTAAIRKVREAVNMANIKVRCNECGLPFEFVGFGCGLMFDRPMVSPSAEELHAPIVPQGERLALGLPGYSVEFKLGDGKVH